jgi:hypothetical protein
MKLEKLKSFESQMISKESTKKIFGGVFLLPEGLQGITGPGEACMPYYGCMSYTHDYETSSANITYYGLAHVLKPC